MNTENSTSVRHMRTKACSLWTALVTPFNQDNTIDFDSIKTLATAQADSGNGILLLGSTGEGLALNKDEQFAIVDYVCNLKLNTPLMVAVAGYNLPDQKQWIKRCNSLAIDAYLLGTPMYAKPGVVGQTQWFSQLLDTADFPCMLYNVPSRSGVEIPVKTVQALQDHPNCWAMKEASGDISKFLQYRQFCPKIELFSGEDAMMPYLAPAGVKGLVSVCANVWPQATLAYVNQCLHGSPEQNQELFPLWDNAVQALFSVANPIPAKVLLHHQQCISTPTLRAPLTHEELTDKSELLNYDQQISLWLTKNIPIAKRFA
ncbi:4-hydroxy-tetrahydrodipicolinate synthase [Litorilituus lipolyticus]|nr:4-hydroxy-tetrahydrodipicolinate synthase [Litorilituus lipolyticus]